MEKPTYYLWKSSSQTLEEYESQKDMYTKLGFRVVTFQDGQADTDINDGLKSLIRNHINDES
ncbi:MAG: hypothetical protein ACRC3H_20865 [Lachnospiraceae bacterium]